MNSIDSNQNCKICYKIICRGCGWEANDEEALKVKREEIVSCPLCGWRPSGEILV